MYILSLSDCPALTAPTNGYLDSTAVSQGSAIGVFCNVNYTLFGDDDTLFGDVLTCQTNAQWDYPVPTCRIGKLQTVCYVLVYNYSYNLFMTLNCISNINCNNISLITKDSCDMT